jgi:hypothetical protein
MTIPAVFPIGKTQWRKWNDAQRGEFNRLRADGVPHQEAIDRVNEIEWVKLDNFFPEPAPSDAIQTQAGDVDVEPPLTPVPPLKKPRAPRKPSKPSKPRKDT